MPVSVEPLSVVAALDGRRVLLTGITGFLGKVWAFEMMERLPDLRLTALVRGRRSESAVDRVDAMLATTPALRPLREAHGCGTADFLAERLDVLPGDVSQVRCGLEPSTVDALRGEIDLVLHFAGLTDFQPDPLAAIAANTHGAVHVAELAEALGVPMVHVSTCYVAGRVDGHVGEDLDPHLAPNGVRFDPAGELAALEADLAKLPSGRVARQDRIDAAMRRAEALGWPNIYTFSKALGERLLVTRPDLDVTIVRPSIVECARAFPFPGWNEGLNTSAPLAWLISTAFRDFPSRDHNHFDIAPVDLVSRGVTLAAAAALSGLGGGVMHLGTSGSNPVKFGRIIELTGLANRRRLREDPAATGFQRAVVARLDPVAVDADRKPLWHVTRLRRAAKGAQKLLKDLKTSELPGPLESVAGDSVRDWSQKRLRSTNEQLRNLGRIEKMLDQYRPFTHDHDTIFANDRVNALSAGLPDEEREAFGYDDHTIDWRQYWYDVEYPGLWTWSIPILFNDPVPEDPPLDPPPRLRRAMAPRLASVSHASRLGAK